MNTAIEQQTYDSTRTITLKLPVKLPYQIFASGFQYLQGEFEYNGESYHLIKQKISNDTLYVVCVENEIKSGIHAKKTLFEKLTNESPGTSKTTDNLLISFSKDFLQNSSCKPLTCSPSLLELSFLYEVFNILEGAGSTDVPPPKFFI